MEPPPSGSPPKSHGAAIVRLVQPHVVGLANSVADGQCHCRLLLLAVHYDQGQPVLPRGMDELSDAVDAVVDVGLHAVGSQRIGSHQAAWKGLSWTLTNRTWEGPNQNDFPPIEF